MMPPVAILLSIGIIVFFGALAATVVGLVAGNLLGVPYRRAAVLAGLLWAAIFALSYVVQSLVVKEIAVPTRVLLGAVLSALAMVFVAAAVMSGHGPRRRR